MRLRVHAVYREQLKEERSDHLARRGRRGRGGGCVLAILVSGTAMGIVFDAADLTAPAALIRLDRLAVEPGPEGKVVVYCRVRRAGAVSSWRTAAPHRHSLEPPRLWTVVG